MFDNKQISKNQHEQNNFFNHKKCHHEIFNQSIS